MSYNGWTNRETWTVNLWLANDVYEYKHWMRRAEHHLGISRTREIAEDNLANEMWRAIRQTSVWPDIRRELQGGSIRNVNWREIASAWLDDIEVDE